MLRIDNNAVDVIYTKILESVGVSFQPSMIIRLVFDLHASFGKVNYQKCEIFMYSCININILVANKETIYDLSSLHL